MGDCIISHVKYLLLLLLCAHSLFARASWAQSLDFTGDISVGVTTINDNHGIARVDATLAFPFTHIEGRPLSFEFGTFAYLLRGDHPHETYAALVFDDRWRLGVVRPAYDLVLPSVFAFTAPSVADTRAEYVRAHATTEAMRFNSVPIGFSYSGHVGEFDWAVSMHDADDGDFRSTSAALLWQELHLQLAFGVEAVWEPSDSFTGINAKVGGRWTGEQWEVGLAYLHPDANQRPDTLAFDLQYSVSNKLLFSTFGEVTETLHDEAYGFAAKYQLTSSSDAIFSATTARDSDELHFTYTRNY